MITPNRTTSVLLLLLLAVSAVAASAQQSSKKTKKPTTTSTPAAQALSSYLDAVHKLEASTTNTTGSLFTPNGRYSNLSADYKAYAVNDLITIQVEELTEAAGTGTVQAKRSLATTSGFSGLLGPLSNTSKLTNIFSPTSSSDLEGQAQTASTSQLTTNFTGRVVEVLPNGYLVVSAVRTIEIDDEQQTLMVNGVVRPADISSNNAVMSTQVGDMEVKLIGHGIISDTTQPPNVLVRILTRILEF